ncbi:hypothetical protein QYE76_035743 [Lolium multiflorum]|uniref:ATP-dependent DNA helicase n=1 Tax=Lolium multiflorum TaxID=4521 RepID=A0AAD8R125_LOLMU|nr:hypothetical protein QYE76_035743 [Lolium multiflorum]
MVGPQRYGSESRVPLGDNFPHCGFYPCVHRSSVRGTWLLRVQLVLVGSRACGSTVPSLPSPTRPPFPAESHAASLLLPLLRRGETIACSRSSARSVPSPARSVTRGQWGFRLFIIAAAFLSRSEVVAAVLLRFSRSCRSRCCCVPLRAPPKVCFSWILDELSQDCETLIKTAEAMQQQLNEDQKVAFESIVDKVRDGKPGLGYKRIVLTVASSGVASLLLPGGRTAHSRFKIPIDLDNNGVCDIRRGTMLSSLIEAVSLIIWDEALMTHRKCFEALDRSLRDVLSANDPLLADEPFGGKVVVLGGDLRQILPVVEGGTRSQVVDAAITNSLLWAHITVLHLTINQRLAVQTTDANVQAEAAAFADWVLSVGDGTVPAVARQGESDPTWITIPNELLVHTDGDKIAAIVESVYVDFSTRYSDPNYLKERAILTPTNEIAEDVNKHVLSMVPGEEREYLSCDSTGNAADGIRNIDIFYPLEVLNTIKMAFNLLSEIHSDSNQWTIRVLVSRMWHYRGGTDVGAIQHTDLVLLDIEGNHMYGQLPPATSERLKDVLEEGKVFVIRKFMCAQSKTAFRPVESPFMVQFTRYTTVEEVPGLADTYPFCTYTLTAFSDIPDPIGRPARFIDVIGKIDMVSDIVPIQSMYQTTASNTRTIILKDIMGKELRLVLWGDRALEFDAEAVRAMGEKESVIAIFVGTLSKTSHGVKSLSGGSACRWYIDEDIPDINMFRERLGPQFVPLAAYVPIGPGAIIPRVFEAPIEKTTEALNDADPFVDMEKKFICTVTVDRLGPDQRWWFASCSVCRKSARHDGYQFQCSGKDCTSVDAGLAASTPKRGARRSLFPSPSKDRSQLDKDSALAADGVLAPGEETATESLVQTASDDAITVGGDKDDQTVVPKPKRTKQLAPTCCPRLQGLQRSGRMSVLEGAEGVKSGVAGAHGQARPQRVAGGSPTSQEKAAGVQQQNEIGSRLWFGGDGSH